MNKRCCVGILAGGKGVRIGGDKPFKIFKDKPLFLWVYNAVKPLGLKVYLSVRSKEQGERLLQLLKDWQIPLDNVSVIQDVVSFEGPLAGVYSLLSKMEEDEIIILACDQPLMKTEILEELLRERATVSLFEIEGRIEPFPIKLPKSLLPNLEEFIANSEKKSIKKIIDFLENYKLLYKLKLERDKRAFFKNVNTPFDLEELSYV